MCEPKGFHKLHSLHACAESEQSVNNGLQSRLASFRFISPSHAYTYTHAVCPHTCLSVGLVLSLGLLGFFHSPVRIFRMSFLLMTFDSFLLLLVFLRNKFQVEIHSCTRIEKAMPIASLRRRARKNGKRNCRLLELLL